MKWIRKQWLRVRLRWILFQVEIDARWPFYCGRCGRWTQYRYTDSVRTTSGQWVRVCGECRDDLYRPFSTGG
ncbi:MAG: hypothetical protein KA314_04890 [Chloroflexi bacterium]|nr:hypothetical protein [Chloroflexota bacterium]